MWLVFQYYLSSQLIRVSTLVYEAPHFLVIILCTHQAVAVCAFIFLFY